MNDQSSDFSVRRIVASFDSADDMRRILESLPLLSEDVRAEAWGALARRLIVGMRQGPEDQKLSWNEWTLLGRARAQLALLIGPPDVGRWIGNFAHSDESDRIMASRSAEWRSAFAAATNRRWATAPEPGMFGHMWWGWWQWLRQEQQMGPLPVDGTSTDYLVVLVRGLLFSGSIEAAIREDLLLAEGPVWLLFEPRPLVQKALLGSEMFWNPANTWRVALVQLALGGVIDRERLERAAAAAALDERMGKSHRAWYRKFPALLANPDLIPAAPDHGPPPPGNRLFPRIR